MKVIKRIRDWWDQVRFEANFRRNDALARSAFIEDLDRRLDISRLETEVKKLERNAGAAADAKFGEHIGRSELKIQNVRQAIAQRKEDLAILLTNHSQELRKAESELQAVRSEKQKLLRAKNSAFEYLNSAQREVREFHKEARDRDLPQEGHWLFGGDSWSDIEPLKDCVYDASSTVGDISEQIAVTARRELNLVDKRTAIFNSRERKRELLKSGFTASSLRKAIGLLESDLKEADTALTRYKAARDSFLADDRGRLGIESRIGEIGNLRKLRHKDITTFDAVSRVEARKRAHRIEWERGRR